MVILHVNVSRVAFTETEREYEALAKHPSQKPKGSMKRWVETEANTYIYGRYILFLVHIIYTSTPLLKSCSSTSQKPARGV